MLEGKSRQPSAPAGQSVLLVVVVAQGDHERGGADDVTADVVSTVANHGSIILLKPITQAAVDWVQRHIGADNGYQPYYPTVILEPRYLDSVIAGIRRKGLVAR